MSTSTVKPIPDGMHSLTPLLCVAGASDAIEFYKKAFNAVEVTRLPGPSGRLLHAMVRIGDSALMLTDEFPEMGGFSPKALKGTPVTIHIYVEDVDAAFAQAVAAGATERVPVSDMFWGDRYGVLVDPFGHHWSLATHKQDLTQQQILDAVANMGR